MSYANNIQNMISHTEHGVKQPSPYYRMFKTLMEYRHFFPFSSTAVVNLTDEDRRHGKKSNHVGVALEFESLRKPHTKIIVSFDYKQGKTNINNCSLKQRISQDVTVDNWNSVRRVVAEFVREIFWIGRLTRLKLFLQNKK